MNTDIRLSTEFFRHPKTLKLKRRLGLEGIISLQQLWIWVAQSRPTGSLAGLDMEDIALAAGWEGDEQTFVQTLITLRWLDEGEDGSLSVHNWTARQEYASRSEERVDKARKAAASRWNKEGAATGQTPQNAGGMPADAQGNARSMLPDATSNANRMLTDARSINKHATSNAKSMPRTQPNPTEPIPEKQNIPRIPLEPDAADAAGSLARETSVPAWEEEPVPLADEPAPPAAPEPPGETGQATERPRSKRGSKAFPREQDWETWYADYPRKVSKQDARTVWARLAKTGELPELSVLMKALEWQKRLWTEPRYIPHPDRYLKGRRWQDQPTSEASPRASPAGSRMSQPIENRFDYTCQTNPDGTLDISSLPFIRRPQ